MKEKLTEFIKDRLDALNLKRVSLDKVQVKSDHVVIHIYGGENGPGRWQNYLGQIDSIIRAFKGSYLVDVVNDCPDDVWYLRLGWRMNDEIRSLLPIDMSVFAKTHPGVWVVRVGEDGDYLYCDNGEMFCYNEEAVLKVAESIEVGQAKNIENNEVITVYEESADMNGTLSLKSSTELFNLGIPYECATTHCIYDAPYRIAGISIAPTFSLFDLLRLLPPFVAIKKSNGDTRQARLFINTIGIPNKYEYLVGYEGLAGPDDETFVFCAKHCGSKQLVDALANLVKWCISEGHIQPTTHKEVTTTTAASTTPIK